MIGLLTPPMAICLFLTSKIGGVTFKQAFHAVKTVLYWVVSCFVFDKYVPTNNFVCSKIIIRASILVEG